MLLVEDLFSFLIMVVDNVIFEARSFEDEFMVCFYGRGESFSKKGKSRDGCYIEQCRCEHSTKKFKCISLTLPKENRHE